jgi:hypothetical protein
LKRQLGPNNESIPCIIQTHIIVYQAVSYFKAS